MIHLRNGRAERLTHQPKTWCGKPLFGPAEDRGDGIEGFTSYGDPVDVTLNPERGTCPYCRERFDAAYNAAFPEGPKPIATFRADDPADVEKFRSIFGRENLTRVFGEGGGGIAELDEQLRFSQAKGEGQ